MLLTMFVMGCEEGQKWAAKHQVSGTLLVNGKPAEGAIVRLYAIGGDLRGKDRNPYGITDAQGRVSFATFTLNDGMPAGEYLVTFRWPFEPKPNSPDRLRRKFSTKSESKIRIQVSEETTELPPFELEVPSEWLEADAQKAGVN